MKDAGLRMIRIPNQFFISMTRFLRIQDTYSLLYSSGAVVLLSIKPVS